MKSNDGNTVSLALQSLSDRKAVYSIIRQWKKIIFTQCGLFPLRDIRKLSGFFLNFCILTLYDSQNFNTEKTCEIERKRSVETAKRDFACAKRDLTSAKRQDNLLSPWK